MDAPVFMAGGDVDDFAGVHAAFGVEEGFDFAEGLDDAGSEEGGEVGAADEAVAVFAAPGAVVFLDDGEDFLLDGEHGVDVGGVAEVVAGADVDEAGAGVGEEGYGLVVAGADVEDVADVVG